MAGKKIFTLEKPDDTAKELAAKLTLEEQVCSLLFMSEEVKTTLHRRTRG
jgi:hypothetical protein